MPGPFLHVGVTALCPHGGSISIVSTNPRVRVSGQPVATVGDQYLVVGCPLNVSSAPHPCVRVQWLVPSTRVRAGGQPVVLRDSTGLCLAADQVPQGPPQVIATQTRVRGS